MAHDIATAPNGSASIAYAGEMPWHKLGRSVEEAMTAQEAMSLASLGYTVEKWPLQAVAPDGQVIPVEDQFMTVRADTKQRLGIVSSQYQVFQNAECFDFLDSVVNSGDLRYEVAGALGVGERVWMLARVPGDIRVKGSDDVTRKYLLLHSGHDGVTAVRCLFTPVRVVCANTVRAALERGAKDGITLSHKGNLQDKVAEAQKALGLAAEYFDRFGEAADHLASRTLKREEVDTYFRELYPDAAGDDKKAKGISQRNGTVRMTLFGLYEQGMGQDIKQIRHTPWAAYNAVTEFIDHHAGNATDQRRLESAWWGEGSRLKAQAFDLAIKLADGKLKPKATATAVSLN